MGKLDEIPMEDLKARAAKRTGKGRVPKKDLIRTGQSGSVRFTPKEAQFYKGMVEDVIPGKKTRQEVALEVYDTTDPGTASAIASENLSKPKFKELLAPAFEKAGLTPDMMATKVVEAMNANKSAAQFGEVIESNVADHTVRLSAIKTAAQLMGVTEDDGEGKGGDTFIFGQGSSANFMKKAGE
jgi:hypothetical protein